MTQIDSDRRLASNRHPNLKSMFDFYVTGSVLQIYVHFLAQLTLVILRPCCICTHL